MTLQRPDDVPCAKAEWSDQEPGPAVIANARGSFEGSGRE